MWRYKKHICPNNTRTGTDFSNFGYNQRFKNGHKKTSFFWKIWADARLDNNWMNYWLLVYLLAICSIVAFYWQCIIVMCVYINFGFGIRFYHCEIGKFEIGKKNDEQNNETIFQCFNSFCSIHSIIFLMCN